MKFKLLSLLCILLSISCTTTKKETAFYNTGINITPKPQKTTTTSTSFTIDKDTKFVLHQKDELESISDFFAIKIEASSGINISNQDNTLLTDNYISLAISDTLDLKEEGYILKVNTSHIEIVGKTAKGVFYGLQTLLQLLPAEIESKSKRNDISLLIPGVVITDEPFFDWRGMHLDVSRHFFGVDFIKKQLDIMAMFKINKFHWHLTDDQGWRLEIKKYPKLTTLGAKRTEADGSTYGEGMFYTQEEVKEVVAYAAARQIDVLPEIDVPGHVIAALVGYPELACNPEEKYNTRILWGVEPNILCAGKEESFVFVEDVMKELATLFPYEYVHIGGDEVPKVKWEACVHCQKRMKDENIENEAKLQTYFMTRVETMLKKYNKKVIGWDELLEGGASKTTTIMSWRGESGGIAAANAGNNVIMTPSTYMYLNFYQGDYKAEPMAFGAYIPLDSVYHYNPIPNAITPANKKHILGLQANIWTEYTLDDTTVEYQTYPRLLAVAETGWYGAKNHDFNKFENRLNNQYVRLDQHQIKYHIPLPEGPSSKVAFTDSTSIDFTTTRPIKMVYTTDGNTPTVGGNEYTKPLVFKESTTLKIASVLPHGKMSLVRTIAIEKQDYKEALDLENLNNGIDVTTYNGDFRLVKDINYEAKAIKSTINSLGQANKTYHWGHELKDGDFRAAILESYIDIAEDGVYYFASVQDQVWIADELIIDNDGTTRKHEINDGALALKKGKHRLKIIYLNNINGGWPTDWNTVNLKIRKSDTKEYTPVTSNMLYRK